MKIRTNFMTQTATGAIKTRNSLLNNSEQWLKQKINRLVTPFITWVKETWKISKSFNRRKSRLNRFKHSNPQVISVLRKMSNYTMIRLLLMRESKRRWNCFKLNRFYGKTDLDQAPNTKFTTLKCIDHSKNFKTSKNWWTKIMIMINKDLFQAHCALQWLNWFRQK